MQFITLSPVVSNVILLKAGCIYTLFVKHFFLLTHCILLLQNIQMRINDKNYNRLIASLGSHYIFGALKKEKSKSNQHNKSGL